MGSSSKPVKKGDRPIISSPRAGGGGTVGSRESDGPTCPLILQVKLDKNPLLHAGLPLRINGDGEVSLSNNTVVGRLSAGQFRTILRCQEAGYEYRGKVVEDKSTLYGEFRRYTA